MSTHYTRPDAGAARAPFPIVSRDVTRYRSAAEICAAITAAAADAPEFSDACFAPDALDWHGPTRGASFAHFLYCIDGARGSYSVSNTRENLLTLARKVNTIRAAFDGKPRRAPAAKRAPTSAPHVAARALLTDGNARDAIQLAENSGAVFFGAAAIGAPGVPYMGCETVEFFGQSFTIGRAIKTGRFLVLHTSTALSVSGSAHREGFKTHSAALDWIETESACDAWREKFLTALHGRSEFDQPAARARYFEDETAPVETIEPAPVETEPVESAPVDAWAPLQPMMRPAEHIARLPLFARLAIERIDADSDLRTGAKLDELLRAYAAQYRETCDDYTRQSAHAIASRRFWNFRPDPAPIEPAAIVPAADPAPAAPRAPRDGDRFYIREWKPGTAHSWRSAAPSDAPRDYLVRQAIIAGYIGGAHRWAECAQTGAFLYGIGADTRPIHAAPVCPDPAPVDPAPRADAAPVDTGAAPGGWMRPATGMLSEAEARAWPSAEPVESAPTPGYAFPADALPATHSDAAEPAPADRMAAAKFARQSAILEKLIRCDGQVMTRRAFLHSKIRDGLRLTVEQHDRIAPMSRMATFRASNEEQRAHDRRILAAGKKDVFFIGGFEITKTEFDYAAEILASMAPAADPAPVPVNSADVDAVEVARLVAKFQQFANERRRTGDTLAAAIRVESAEARYRADSLTAPNAFRDAPGAGHEAAKAHDSRRAAEYRAAAAELDRLADATPADDAAPVATHSAPIAEPVRYCIHRLRRVHDEINATRATTTTARGRRWVRIMNALRSLMSEHPERRAPVPADTLPADTAPTYVDVFADGFGFYCYSLRDGSKWTGRPSFEAAAAELAGMGMQARAAGLNPPVPADTAPDDDTTPAPLDGLDVIETADAETLAEFDRLSRAPGVSQPASDARPIPSGPVLRIPVGDLRARIPARFAPAYLLTA